MFPSSQSDMDKFCCNRSSCSKRRQHHENSSQQTSSIEEIEEKPEFSWNKFNQETQMSASITTTTSSEKTSMPTREYDRKMFDIDTKIVHEQMANYRIFKKQLKQLKALSKFLENCLHINSKVISPNCEYEKISETEDSKIIHIEIPLEIHLKVRSKFSKVILESNIQKTLPYPTTSYAQTGALTSACSLQISKDYENAKQDKELEEHFKQERTTTLSTEKQTFKEPSNESSICDCEREKLTEERLQELMKKPNSRLVALICENKLKCVCDLEEPKIPKELPKKYYRLAYPQHKDLDVCVKCRYEPSPLIDENNQVFCPGKCGCCLCAWKPPASNSSENVLLHRKIKVCKCRKRCTLFENMGKFSSSCSQVSYFDICPCRERAEAKFLALFGKEMWNEDRSLNNIDENKEVLLEDVKEIYDKEGKLIID